VLHEPGGIAALPPGVRVLKDLSDIGEGEGAENGIDDRVVDDVPVRVGDDAQLGLVDPALFDVFALGVRPLGIATETEQKKKVKEKKKIREMFLACRD
jgi:hypothetical protein